MNGPYASGSLLNPAPPSEGDWEAGRLARGQRYQVIKPFIDGDGDRHQPGEIWTFIASTFSQYDGELTIMVRLPSGEEFKIPLLESAHDQLDVIEGFANHVAPIPS